jgi:hypothetical protein
MRNLKLWRCFWNGPRRNGPRRMDAATIGYAATVAFDSIVSRTAMKRGPRRCSDSPLTFEMSSLEMAEKGILAGQARDDAARTN